MKSSSTNVRRRKMDDIFLPCGQLEHAVPTGVPHESGKLFLWRLTVPFLVVFLCATSVGIAGGVGGATISYFRDNEFANGNAFRAGFMSFTVEAAPTSHDFNDGNPDTAFINSRIHPVSNGLPAQYKITFDTPSGALCSALHATATTSPFSFDGSPLSFSTTTTSLLPLSLGITLPDASGFINGDACSLNLRYSAWTGVAEGAGYTDSAVIPLTFTFTVGAPQGISAQSLIAPQEDAASPKEPTAPNAASSTSLVEDVTPPPSNENTTSATSTDATTTTM